MFYKVNLVIIILLSLTSSLVYGIDSNENRPTYEIKITSIKDGDSFEALTTDNKIIKIRLWGIDCPERGQAFSQQAKNTASEFIFKQTVQIKEIDQDRYGRTIADIYINNKTRLSELLIEQGLCRWYERYAPNDQILKNLEQAAKNKGLGIWSLKNELAPWDYRANERILRHNKAPH